MIRIKETPIKELDKGHIAIYGQTMTGKTRYAKAIIENILKPIHCYVFLGSPSNDWDNVSNIINKDSNINKESNKLIKDNSKLNYIIYKEWEAIDNVIKLCMQHKANNEDVVIVFDDFNECLHGNSDPKYLKLFTQGRHLGIRVINMSQDMKGIAKSSRENIRYVAATFCNNLSMIKALSDNFLNDLTKLQDNMTMLKGNRNVILIDTKFGDIVIDNALNYESNKLDPLLFTSVNHLIPESINPLISKPINTMVNPIIPIINQNDNNIPNNNITPGQRNIYNNGTYNDNSVINFQNNQEIQHQIQVNQWNNQKMEINYHQQRKMKRISERDELYDLLNKYMLSFEDKLRIIELLKSQCGLDNIDAANWRHYAQKFMNHYYPNTKWGSQGICAQLLTEHTNVLTNPNIANVSDFFYTNAKKIIKNNEGNNGLIGNIVNRTPIKYLKL